MATNDIRGFEELLIDFCTDSRLVKNYALNDGDPLGYGWGYVADEATNNLPPPVIKRDGNGMYSVAKIEWPAGKRPRIEWRVGRIGTIGVADAGSPAIHIATSWRNIGGHRRMI